MQLMGFTFYLYVMNGHGQCEWTLNEDVSTLIDTLHRRNIRFIPTSGYSLLWLWIVTMNVYWTRMLVHLYNPCTRGNVRIITTSGCSLLWVWIVPMNVYCSLAWIAPRVNLGSHSKKYLFLISSKEGWWNWCVVKKVIWAHLNGLKYYHMWSAPFSC